MRSTCQWTVQVFDAKALKHRLDVEIVDFSYIFQGRSNADRSVASNQGRSSLVWVDGLFERRASRPGQIRLRTRTCPENATPTVMRADGTGRHAVVMGPRGC